MGRKLDRELRFIDSQGRIYPENMMNPRSPMYNEGVANDTHIPLKE